MIPNSYSMHLLSNVTGGNLVTLQHGDPEINELLIDSRRLVDPEHCLFVALVTSRNDGHRYIEELYGNGARCFLVSQASTPEGTPWTTPYPGGYFLVVNDTLAALQQIAAYHRSRFTLPVIGITGSNGKTIVKEWLFQLLSPDYQVIRSPKSFNSQIGVPLSVWKTTGEHSLAIFEAGISQPGEMERLRTIIRPTIGVLTNIGDAHAEHFTGQLQKAKEKIRLFREADILVYNRDYTVISEALASEPLPPSVKYFTWSRRPGADMQVTEVRHKSDGSQIHALYRGMEESVTIPFTDDASVENAVHCWAVMICLGYAPASIRDRMQNLVPIALRLELKEAINHCSLINDSYNSDVNSLGIAVDFLVQQNQHKKKTLILSDILQSGRDKQELYREIGEMLSRKGISRFIGIGRDLVKNQDKFPMQKAFFLTTDEFLSSYPLSSFQDETILLKGARLFEFEKISQALQQKAHETVLEINLDAIVHNLNYYRSLLKPGVRTMAMVKAFSYGSGSYEIANLLQFHRVDYLAVAYADEGVELRRAGIHIPVMVMSPEEQSLDLLLKYNLEPEIYNLHILRRLDEAIHRSQTTSQEAICIHLKIDSGMHRLGFQEAELPALLKFLAARPYFRVKTAFSHLAASEDPAMDDFTRVQVDLFTRLAERIEEGLGYPVLRHILNSAGISRFPEAQMDMVRLGIGMYGVGFDSGEQRLLRNVSTLKSVITQVKDVKSGETIGYNRKGVALRDTRIAIVPVGYADGFNRRLGNGKGKMHVNGCEVPTIGNICMDLTMIDITGLEETGTRVAEGDEVIIFGDAYPVTEMASDLGTIPYEVLTGISRRVKRIYFHE